MLLDIHPELEDILYESMDSTKIFMQNFMPRRVKRAFTSIHDEFFSILDDPSKTRVAIAAPRGWGKTTIDSIGFGAKNICFKERSFIELVSCTAGVAAQNVRNLGRELLGNAEIVKLFGNLEGSIWSEGVGRIETSNGVMILARGAGQQIRGLLEGESRPDLVVVDDLEDPERFRTGDSAEYLKVIKEWFWADLMNSLSSDPNTRVIVVGTILHEDSLLQNLLDDPDWYSMRIELCDDNYRSNFPDFMTTLQVQKLAKQYAARGQLDVFAREFRNLAMAAETAIFKRETFKYYDEKEYNPISDYNVNRAVIVDPTKTTNPTSDYSAINGIGINPSAGKIYFIDSVNERITLDNLYNAAWKMAKKLRTYTIAVEVTSLNDWIVYPFNNFLASKGFPPVVELKAKGKKTERIRQLTPFYAIGCVYHNNDITKHTALESQLTSFPRGKYVDVIDCFAYAIPLFNIGEQFFAMAEEDDPTQLEDELREIEEMDQEEREEETARHGSYNWAP